VFEVENIHLLTLIFFFIALFYSLVGLGGGSSYIALLIFWGISHKVAPSIALICNIIVVFGGTVHFFKNDNLSYKFISPFLILSVPFAYLGGLIPIEKELYQSILGLALLIAAYKMLFLKKDRFSLMTYIESPPLFPSAMIGGILGLVSGLVGIGGGIFLAPLLYILKWGNPKRIAASSSAFILINSFSGLFGQLQKSEGLENIYHYLPLLLSVFIGGQLGSWFCNNRISFRKIEVLTSLLVFLVSLKLFSNVLAYYN